MPNVSFSIRLIFRCANTCRDDGSVVMLCQFLIGFDQDRLVLIALLPIGCGRSVIWNQYRSDSTEKSYM